MQIASQDFLNVQTKRPKRRYRKKEHTVFEYRHNLAITLSPEVADRFTLVAGLDCCLQEIQGDVVILRFYRKGAPSI
ncbi:MAG TPA: hypothetical protein VGQ13_10135 [Nitrososphaera sp.]|jgi:hypothetical protein|nr:hypothetical protein [Nitrososphaera sp.]